MRHFLVVFHLVFLVSVEGLSSSASASSFTSSSTFTSSSPSSSPLSSEFPFPPIILSLGWLLPLLFLALRSSSSSAFSFAKLHLTKALRRQPLSSRFCTPSSSSASSSASSSSSSSASSASRSILKRDSMSSIGGRRAAAGKLTFATNSEHLTFNRDDPPLVLCKNVDSLAFPTPNEAETPESGDFSGNSDDCSSKNGLKKLKVTLRGAVEQEAKVAEVKDDEEDDDGSDVDTQHNAEEEASSSSFGYEGFSSTAAAAADQKEEEGGNFVYNEQKMLRWRVLQCGEDSGTESEAESEASEASEGGDDSFHLGSLSQSPSVYWEFFKGRFTRDAVETRKEHEIYSFEDFHTNWGKICSVSNLPQGSVVQFLKHDHNVANQSIAGHWWISLKGGDSSILASVWSDVLLTLMGFIEMEEKSFLDNLLGAEFRVGAQHTHLLIASTKVPVNNAAEKAELKKGFQLDGQCEIKFV